MSGSVFVILEVKYGAMGLVQKAKYPVCINTVASLLSFPYRACAFVMENVTKFTGCKNPQTTKEIEFKCERA